LYEFGTIEKIKTIYLKEVNSLNIPLKFPLKNIFFVTSLFYKNVLKTWIK